ncbi:sterile alpha motif domain-containing protein 3-like [Dermacentor albipictus]|uniref:sterile alpha motif domain-containing protein 3-like n=1 Tax=Dermacentor albipictus TaxID=60249 RepID=UPI0038FC0A1C
MASKCLVMYGASNVVVTFDEPCSRQDLLGQLAKNETFKDVDVCALGLTIFDEDFETFVEITEDSAIHNKAKIKVKETNQVRIADVLEKGPPQQARPGHVYMLPTVPQDISMSIERHRAGQYFKNRRRVLQWLYHDLCLQTMYPGKLYAEAAQALIAKFPNLADSTGTGYDSWREALRFKAKYERRKLRLQEDTDDGPPPKRSVVVNNDSLATKRITRPFSVAAMEDGEDNETIDAHVVAMAKEVTKARPDFAYISDCMARTFASRRKWIGENPSVGDIVKMYPALSMSTMAQLEFHQMTTVAVTEKLEEVLAKAAQKIIMASKKKRHLQSFLQRYEETMSGISEASHYEMTLTAAICLLPSMVKERMETFICSSDPTVVHYVPTITYEGDLLETTSFSVCLEGLKIEERSLLAAVATLLALYWAFNIVFVKKGQKTLDLLCRLIQVDSGVPATPLVRVSHSLLMQ